MKGFTCALLVLMAAPTTAQKRACDANDLTSLGDASNGIECLAMAQSVVPESGEITGEEVKQLCDIAACSSLLADLDIASLPDCEISIPTTAGSEARTVDPKELFTLYDEECSAGGAGSTTAGEDAAKTDEDDDDSSSTSSGTGILPVMAFNLLLASSILML